MVDFRRLHESFLTDAYQEDIRIYRDLRSVDRRMRTGTVTKDRNFEPSARLTRTRCWEKSILVAQNIQERKKNALQFLEDITSQKKDLYDQEQAFQQRFFEFNEQINLNEQKRERALANSKENRAYIKARSRQIEFLLRAVLKLRQYKQQFLEEIRKHLIYEEFLGSALYDSGSRTFYDVITRYCNLESKKRYLNARHLQINDQLKTMYQESLERLMVYHEEVMNMRSQISRNMVRYEEAVNRTTQLECLQMNLWDSCASRLEDIVLSIQGIRNLNEIMKRRSLFKKKSWMYYVETESMPDVFHDLANIKGTMHQLFLIMKKVETRLKIIKKLWGKEGYRIFDKSPKL